MKKRPSMNIGAAILFGIFGLLFFVLMVRFVTIQVTGEAEGKVLASQAAKKYIKSHILEAHRGTIFDGKGEVIAEDTSAYTLVAILDPSITSDPKKPKHVTDPEKTAKVLAEYLDMKESEIYDRLNKKGPYQVEFGAPGRDLSHQKMLEIKEEDLPGVTFRKEAKRFYPNGSFASHLIGFAQKTTDDDGDSTTIGKMGVEASFNDVLKGKDGSVAYKSDVWGYLLPNADEHVTPPEDGDDLYLTIDKKIQTFLEEAMNEVQKKYKPKKMFAIVSDPKTGKILAMSQRPTFHPDTREGLLDNWTNIIVEDTYEPGSTMKSFSLAAAVNEGKFNPNETYESGKFYVENVPNPIRDHNGGEGWGTISYLEGVQRSSNVAFANLLDKIGFKKYEDYLHDFGFGEATDVGLPNEASGSILYHYPIEKYTTIFGQGTTVTPLQMVQAESAIANNGKMMKPYVISKIVDPNTKKVIKETKPEVSGSPISKETAIKTREYLETTVTSEHGTGQKFAIEGYRVGGKSGSGQIPDPANGRYMVGKENYLFSFMGMAPIDDPQLIVYVGVQQPELEPTEIGSDPVSAVFNPVMQNSLKYLNIKPQEKVSLKKQSLPDTREMSLEEAKKDLEKAGVTPIVVGNGSQVVKQLPQGGNAILEGERVVIKTDGDMTIPDMKGWSVRDVFKVANIAGLKMNMVGNGFAVSQNIQPGAKVKKNEPLVINFKTPEEESAQVADDEQPVNE
ncbi:MULTISPECIES: penicillin-binding protein [Bacillaceae]|uniref:penicillin-binding protein n=1 Tax=Bacillaceae TaxID=186817 RepID=UPI001C56E058|nr:penicillin-binding transpeptidase domain-containing protein [Rossellomorea sp. YZS02]MBW3113968.1 penicillin-binding protein [Bacillus sp. MCCB 382]MDX8343001.1 penicillin-binding transpeptidase domain-containing protein [Rossellomorea sp. YZS02]